MPLDQTNEEKVVEPVEGAAALSDSDIWGDLANEVDDIGAELEAEPAREEVVGGEAEPKSTEPVVAETPPTTTPPAQPQVPTTPEVIQSAPVTQAGQPQAPTAPVEPPPVTPPYQFVPTPEQIEHFRTQVIDGLAKIYAISPDDAAALQLEPEKALPRLAANVHAQVYSQIMTEISQRAPAIVEQVMLSKRSAEKAEEAFYTKWPQLRAHPNEVTRAAMIYRQMSPQTSLEEAIEATGRMVHAALGIQFEGAPGNPLASAPPPPPPPPPAPASVRAAAPPRSKLDPNAQAFADLATSWDSEEEI
jgi:hypothetical protein